MWSNNDLMDPSWKPGETPKYERDYNKWYANFNGCPNTVHVKDYFFNYLRERDAAIEKLVHDLENFPIGHSHWDSEGTSGLNCPLCLDQKKYKMEALEAWRAATK